MGRNGFFAVIFIIIVISNTSNASIAFNFRKLIANQSNNASADQSPPVSPTGSPVSGQNKIPTNSGKPEEEKQIGNQNGSKTLPTDSNNVNKSSGDLNPPAVKNNGSNVDKEDKKMGNPTTPKLGNNYSCEGSVTGCREKSMFACIESPKIGSNEMFIVVQNEGENELNGDVSSPNSLKNASLSFEVPKHEAKRMDISSIVGMNTELLVRSGDARCVLRLANPVSVDNLVKQLSFYSKQVTPKYGVYASFLLVLVFGGTWACCKCRKRNQGDGIPYQELEMGLPESGRDNIHADASEGWDHEWDEDWDEESAVKSPASKNHVSADGLTSRSPKKDGWEDWED